ncbi:MAG: hypothetical protein KatS3mg070_0055 [Meiothermus sp.]|nr:MAG: hypothetical protein KatS3mg070_0055 [Meiothermus sp.]
MKAVTGLFQVRHIGRCQRLLEGCAGRQHPGWALDGPGLHMADQTKNATRQHQE